MNTRKIKDVGKWMMVVGCTIFTSGAGCYFVGGFIEQKEEERIHKIKLKCIEEEKIKAETEKDKVYTERLKNMDQKAFAEFHADRVSMANEKVMKEAERLKKEAEAEVIRVRLECNEKADKKRDDAIQKYEAINALFTNKNEILKAKEALDDIIQKDKKTKDDKEDLLENIKEMLS